jgi:hypothetical protein
MTSGQITYDLRRLRIHGLICRIPHSFRYQVTRTGLRQALFLTRLTQKFLIPGLAQLTDPSLPAPARLRGRRPRLRSLPRPPRPPGRTDRLTLLPAETSRQHQI